jgi:1-acyl-sn-glycerol-3-phosphate acyltransferase
MAAAPSPSPLLTPPSAREDWVRAVVSAILRPYFAVWHQFAVTGHEHLPPGGPLLTLFNHASLLDPPALLLADPYPSVITFAKASLFSVPFVGWFLRHMGAIPVERQGRDLASLRTAVQALREGKIVGAAAEGRRTRSGRLEAVNPVLARLAMAARVPILPVGIVGTFAALPPGAVFPRRRPVAVHIGPTFRLEPRSSVADAQRRIRDAIAALLPANQQPLAVNG